MSAFSQPTVPGTVGMGTSVKPAPKGPQQLVVIAIIAILIG